MEDDLKKELNEIKAQAYDMDSAYNNYREELRRKMEELSVKIDKLNAKEEVVENEETISMPEEVQSADEPVTEPVQEEEKDAVEEPVQVPAVEGETQEEVVEGPVLPPVEVPEVTEEVQPVSEDVVNPQTLDSSPLTPVGVEIPAIVEKEADKEVFIKEDTNAPRAILVNQVQSDKLRKSKELNKSMAFNDASSDVVTIPSAESIEVVPNAGAEKIEVVPNTEAVVESPEEINKQLEAMVAELATTTDEVKANELNNQISVLTKKLGQTA